jgi:hypothetical protein
VIVLFAEGVPEIFRELPREIQWRAAESIELISAFPLMYPVRRRGIMRGYRYFAVGRFLFYYSVTSDEIRIRDHSRSYAPGVMVNFSRRRWAGFTTVRASIGCSCPHKPGSRIARAANVPYSVLP